MADIGFTRTQRDLLHEEFLNQESFPDIIEWVKNNPKWFLSGVQYLVKEEIVPEIWDSFQIEITFLNVLFYDSVTNTHSCPMNGVRNFSSEEGKPIGYPGWEGRIEFQYNPDIMTFSSDLLRQTCLHVGTGGGRPNNRCGYSLRMFLDDWIGLKRLRMQETLCNKFDHTQSFRWGDPFYFKNG